MSSIIGNPTRRALPRVLLGALAAIAAAACGDVPTDDTNFPPQGAMRGSVLYDGPLPCTLATVDSLGQRQTHVLGQAVLLVFNQDLLPPPEGFGTTAAQLGVVAGDELFAGIADQLPKPEGPAGSIMCPPPGTHVTVSAPWSIGPVPVGRWQVRAFYDYDGDFSPILKIHQLPTAGDIGGGAVANPEEGKPVKFQTIEIGVDRDGDGKLELPKTGVLVDNISVSLAQTLTFPRPLFNYNEVIDERPASTMTTKGETITAPPLNTQTDPQHVVLARDERFLINVTNPANAAVAHLHFIRFHLKAGLLESEQDVGVAEPFFLQGRPPYNKFYIFPNTDEKGAVKGIPESPPGLAVADLFPQIIFGKLDERADAKAGKNQTAQASPAVIMQGINLNGVAANRGKFTDLLGGAVPKTPTATEDLFVGIRPTVICLDPLDVNKMVYVVTPSFTALNGDVLVEPKDLEPKIIKQLGNRPNVKVVTGCLPKGTYQTNLVYPTGQAWTMPNEAGNCSGLEVISGSNCTQAGQSRPTLASQSTIVTIDGTRDDFCKTLPPDPRAPELTYVDGTPTVCLRPDELSKYKLGREAGLPHRTTWVTEASAVARGGHHTLVAIGKFDGVHLGHQSLLRQAAARARAEGSLPVVLTFHPHPAEVLGRVAPPTLTPLHRKAHLIRAIEPDVRLVAQRFDRAYAGMSPREFAQRVLVSSLGARGVVVGQNFRFGKDRAGDFDTLRALGTELGFEVWAEPLSGDARGRWSSTRVRKSLAAGDLDDANDVLGRAYELEGVVEEGQRRGRTIGFPTANLGSVLEALPAFGVYAVRVSRVDEPGSDGVPLALGVANIGVRPTVAAGFSVEAHLFDFAGDLYGARLRIALVARLREERTFPGLAALVAQIEADAVEARKALAASSVDTGTRPG